MAGPAKTKSFKERLDELSCVVEKLEGGDLSLEEAIERFEEGRRLHRALMEELAGYEKRLEKLALETEPGYPQPAAPIREIRDGNGNDRG